MRNKMKTEFTINIKWPFVVLLTLILGSLKYWGGFNISWAWVFSPIIFMVCWIVAALALIGYFFVNKKVESVDKDGNIVLKRRTFK
jgi:hypothetical protein